MLPSNTITPHYVQRKHILCLRTQFFNNYFPLVWHVAFRGLATHVVTARASEWEDAEFDKWEN